MWVRSIPIIWTFVGFSEMITDDNIIINKNVLDVSLKNK